MVLVAKVGSRWLPTDHLEALSWIRGIPAAFVTIAASYLASFNHKEDAVRHEVTSNELWNELAKYSAGAEPYNKETTDTSNFLNNVCKIVDNELRSWRAVVEGKPEDENDNDDVIRKEREKAKAGEEKQKADAEAAPEAGKTDVAPRKGHFDRLWAVKVIRPNVLSGLLPIRVCNLVFAGAYLSTT